MAKFNDDNLKTHSLIKAKQPVPCRICQESTSYIEYCYEVPCCSTECLSKLNEDYNEAMKSNM